MRKPKSTKARKRIASPAPVEEVLPSGAPTRPVATPAVSGYPIVEPRPLDAADWDRVEAAGAVKLDEERRAAIVQAFAWYLDRLSFFAASIRIPLVRNYLEKLDKQLSVTQAALSDRLRTAKQLVSETKSDAVLDAAAHFLSRKGFGIAERDEFATLLGRLRSASREVLNDLGESRSGSPPKPYMTDLVADLLTIYEAAGGQLVYTQAEGSEREYRGAFIDLVETMQELAVPVARFRRDRAAIVHALRSIRKPKKTR